jgi:hypothetical protein
MCAAWRQVLPRGREEELKILSENYPTEGIVVVEKQSVKYKPLSTQLDDGNVT